MALRWRSGLDSLRYQDSVQQDRQGVSHDHYLKYRPDRRCHRLGRSSHRPSFRSTRPAHRRRPRSRSLRLRFASRRVHSRSPRLAVFQEGPGTVSSQREEALASSLPLLSVSGSLPNRQKGATALTIPSAAVASLACPVFCRSRNSFASCSPSQGVHRTSTNTILLLPHRDTQARLPVCWSSHPNYGVKAELHSAGAPALTPFVPHCRVQQDRKGFSKPHAASRQRFRPLPRSAELVCRSAD